jgi:hypothetical protein
MPTAQRRDIPDQAVVRNIKAVDEEAFSFKPKQKRLHWRADLVMG